MGPLIFLDTETTGFDASRDHIIEIACVRWEYGKITDKFESLFNPHLKIPYEIAQLTGIDDAELSTAPLFSEVKSKIVDFIGDLPIVGHNIAFDAGFLRSHHCEIKNAEIDTVALAKILLRKEPSYALEVLMKRHGIRLRDSHRAMVDVQTTVEFFEFLLGKIGEIPEEVLGEIQAVLEKSTWSGKEIFIGAGSSDCPQKTGSPTPAIFSAILPVGSPRFEASCSATFSNRSATGFSASFSGNHELPAPTWSEAITASFLAGQKILLESSAQIPFAEIKTPLLVAYASQRKRDELTAAASGAGKTVGALSEPGFYLSPKKLAALSAVEKFSAEETPFLLKMLLWGAETKTGDREEVSLEREEYGFFELVADSDGTDVFWAAALSKANGCDVVLVHQYGFARGVAETIAGKNRALVITEASRLEESFTNAFQKKYTDSRLRPFFGDRTTMIFGLLGIFHDHFSSIDEGGYRGNVIMDQKIRSEIEWQRFQQAAFNLPEHPQKKELLASLEPQENKIQWVSSYLNEVAFQSAPVALGELFQKLAAKFEHALLQSEALSGDGSFRLVRGLFGLASNWREEKEAAQHTNLDIKIPHDFPEPYNDGYFKKCLALFMEIIVEKKGRALFILNSKKTVEAIYRALLPKVETLDVKLLAVGASGGTGKSLALFMENPEKSVLITTNQIMHRLPEIENAVDTIVFQKIPFDPPSDPLLSARSSHFANGFKDYTLPRAIMKFKELLAELGKSSPKICHLLDSRLNTRDYGRLFI